MSPMLAGHLDQQMAPEEIRASRRPRRVLRTIPWSFAHKKRVMIAGTALNWRKRFKCLIFFVIALRPVGLYVLDDLGTMLIENKRNRIDKTQHIEAGSMRDAIVVLSYALLICFHCTLALGIGAMRVWLF